MVEFKMPSLGADMESGFLREWRVRSGDLVKRGDIIAEVETQKGIVEIEVFDEGVVGDLLINIDDKVPVGTLMTYILTPEEASAGIRPQPSREQEQVIAELKSVQEKSQPAMNTFHHVRASPLARKVAEEKGISLSRIRGSGPEGAITRADVEKAATEKLEAPAERSASENVRKAVAAAMSKSNREVPHYYLQTKVDMSHALTWLADANKQRSVKDRLLPVVLLIKAVARALGDVPDLNGWWCDGVLQQKKGIHIGFVVSLRGGGVIVPALHHADKKSLDELMTILSDIIPRARALKLRSSELADSTITVTSLGEGAVETVYGIIYPPQVALVGFGGIIDEPWAEKGMLGIRPVVTVSLSADHRATDGNTGSQFLSSVKKYLSNPDLL